MQQASPNYALVTGSTGFIGGHLARRLLAEGWRVKVLVRDVSKIDLDVEIIQGDLADIAALERAVADVAVIFHCAAKVDSWGRREDYWAVNVTGTENLLRAIAKINPDIKRLVHLSTVDVYGFPKEPCDETAPITQTGFGYGDSKGAGEVYVREFCAEHNIPYTIIRPCNVIGPGSQFIERIGKELCGGVMLTIDKGRANAGILYVDTLIDHMLWAADNINAVSQCYNIRDAYDVSWGKFIKYFRNSLKSRGLIVNLPFGLADMFSRICVVFYRVFMPRKEPLLHPLLIRIFGRTCGHSARKILAANPDIKPISFEEAMQRSIAWYKAKNS